MNYEISCSVDANMSEILDKLHANIKTNHRVTSCMKKTSHVKNHPIQQQFW